MRHPYLVATISLGSTTLAPVWPVTAQATRTAPFFSPDRITRYTAQADEIDRAKEWHAPRSRIVSKTRYDFSSLCNGTYAYTVNERSAFQSTEAYVSPAPGRRACRRSARPHTDRAIST